MLDTETKYEMDDLKRQLKLLETEEMQLKDQLDLIAKQKRDILEKLASKADADYEKEMLARVYEQRRKK